jgi:putative nucleotidyltransferase with HDIG domain
MLDYQKLVRAAEALDPVPVSVSRLVSIVARDNWAFSDVEQVIAYDQALTGRLLQIANSAASATLVRIGTVKEAIIRVGIGPVLSFAMAASIGKSLRRALPQYGLGEGDLWRHSVAAALAAEVLTAMCTRQVPPEAVTAALLHDVGKLVLARYLTPELLVGLAEARVRDERSSMQAEVEVLGVHHGALGGLIVRHWNLPDRLAEAITHHHDPDRAHDVICDVVHIANVAAKRVHDLGAGAPSGAEAVCPGSMERLHLGPSSFDRLISHVERRLADVAARYEVASTPRVA